MLQDEVRPPHSLTARLGDGSGDIWLETEVGNIRQPAFSRQAILIDVSDPPNIVIVKNLWSLVTICNTRGLTLILKT